MEHILWVIGQAGGVENVTKLAILAATGVIITFFVTIIFRKLAYGYITNAIIGIFGPISVFYLLQTYFEWSQDISFVDFDNNIDYTAAYPLIILAAVTSLILLCILGILKRVV